MTDTAPSLSLAPPRRYNVLGVELSRETLSLVALALAAGIVIGARIQRSAAKLHGCEECERTRLETARSIARGARDFEDLRRRADGGGGNGGSEGVSASPPPPSPADPTIDPELLRVHGEGFGNGGPPPETVESPQGGTFPYIPPPPDPLELGELLEEPHGVE